MFEQNDHVRSNKFGVGTVILDRGPTVLVRFDDAIRELEVADLERLCTPEQAIHLPQWHVPLEVLTRMQAETIYSINDAWGVFSSSLITLLPHQLWVCRRVLQEWPTRWLIADDVGLGKTIEAGLILLPLLARARIKRLLILAPASLVDQWHYRLRTMFGIGVTPYLAEADTARSDYWNSTHQVVASLHTLRMDRPDRRQRLLAAEPWDIVLVDEAHHLNADEERGLTLGYKLIEELDQHHRIKSMVFFTGTPHRGKNYGFFSLLKLLRPDMFDPRRSMREQLPHLRKVMIRNNKQNVTDLKGQRLFAAPKVRSETYMSSAAESHFYDMLTEFITSGKAYASTLSKSDGRAVMLVLIAMQKLASSSVAAIRRALRGRLERITRGQDTLKHLEEHRSRLLLAYADAENNENDDILNALDECIGDLAGKLMLMQDEAPQLRELITAAEKVESETKIEKILDILENEYADRSVLIFTEYKATQSLLMSALNHRFGDGCVTFINGENRAEEVLDHTGRVTTVTEKRERAAERFNQGQVRFLIATEAGGEGIDLQERCYSLIHADLPWNPMRLHQRVGRLNRYGQTRQVEVFTLRNPDTVEARIWDKLNHKIANIMSALTNAMDEPEDLLQLVLGMTSSGLFREIFAEAADVPESSLGKWFDHKTGSFGGQDAIDTVRNLIGNCDKFDFQEVSRQIPRVDLGDLRPFFVSMLELNHRKPVDAEGGLTFKTPELWAREIGIGENYSGMVFDRSVRGQDATKRILGVGHRVVDRALAQARETPASVASISADVLPEPIAIFRVVDRVTDGDANVRSIILAVEGHGPGEMQVLRDSDLLLRLNDLTSLWRVRKSKDITGSGDQTSTQQFVQCARNLVEERLPDLKLPFRHPEVSLHGLLLPSPTVS